jgi:hypothetical protein
VLNCYIRSCPLPYNKTRRVCISRSDSDTDCAFTTVATGAKLVCQRLIELQSIRCITSPHSHRTTLRSHIVHLNIMSDRRITFASSISTSPTAAPRSSSVSSLRPSSKAGMANVSSEEIKAAFSFFDVSNRGAVTVEELRARLSVFYTDLTPKEYSFMMMGKVSGTVW